MSRCWASAVAASSSEATVRGTKWVALTIAAQARREVKTAGMVKMFSKKERKFHWVEKRVEACSAGSFKESHEQEEEKRKERILRLFAGARHGEERPREEIQREQNTQGPDGYAGYLFLRDITSST